MEPVSHLATIEGFCGRVVRAAFIVTLVFAACLFGRVGDGSVALASAPAVRVNGNHLVDAGGTPLRLLGINRSLTEAACIWGDTGYSIFGGPSDNAAIAAMASWHINALRIPLNEDCWLGINGVNPAYSGAAYRSAIQDYVSRLHAAGIVAILDLHYNAPGLFKSYGTEPMADADHALDFWRSVATAFKGDPSAVFDLYNEPYISDWNCWQHGCVVVSSDIPTPWIAAGMQSLVAAVRSTGATNVVMLGGLGWANDASGWLSHLPTDPAGQTALSFHVYPTNGCITASCWSSTLGPIASRYPIITGEIGEYDDVHTFIDGYMTWADQQGVSYLGWTWNAPPDGPGPKLITNYDGTPSSYGIGLRDHLAVLAGG